MFVFQNQLKNKNSRFNEKQLILTSALEN